MGERKAVIYCSAAFDIDPRFNEMAREIVRALCGLGYDIVSGGTIKGTMEVVASTAADCGAGVIGILPKFMKGLEHPRLTTLVWTDTMSERKEAMREGTCLAVALPGGIGTMDELLETLTLAKLHKYSGKVVAVNLFGFYDTLKALLDHFVATGMLDKESRELISFPQTVEEFLEAVKDQ